MRRETLEREFLRDAQKELERRLKQRDAAQRKLREYVSQAWHVVEPGTTFKPNWHLDAICDHLEAVTLGHIRFLIINIPPRCMKSLAVSVFWPTWEWTKKPETRWLCSSYAQSLSVRDSVKCRRMIQSPWYQSNWGDVFQLTGDQNEKIRFENDKTGYRIATSVDGAGTGEGGDRIVVDDPISADEADSDVMRENANHWWDDTMSTRGNDPKTAAYVVVMQRLHENDLAGHILKSGLYTHLNLPMEYESSRKSITYIGAKKFFEDPRKTDGELLWPDRIDENELKRFKATMTSYAIAGQFQQRPSPEEGGVFKRSWFRYYGPKSGNQIPTSGTTTAQSWDMSFKDTKGSDFVCGMVITRSGPNFYVRDRDKRRLDCPATIQAVETMSLKWPDAFAKYIEDKANGPAVISSLRMKLHGLIEVNPEGGKLSRANAIAPVVEAGNVYLPEDAPWLEDFLHEICAFPNATHDDQVDAFTQGILRLLKAAGGIFAWYDQKEKEQSSAQKLEQMKALTGAANVSENTSLQSNVRNATIALSSNSNRPKAEVWNTN